MKKYLILTSVFALAACGGGGGGGSHVSTPSSALTPSSGGVTFSSGTLFTNTENNSNVTQMKTQIVIDEGGHVVNPTIRSGSIRSGSVQDVNGNTYKVYDLEDVKLRVAEETGNAFLKIGLAEDGAIDKITMSVGGVESNLARVSEDSNIFRGPIFEYVPDGDDRAEFRMGDGTEFSEDLTSIEGFADSLDENGYATMETLEKIATAKGLTGGHWNRVDERIDVQTNKHISEGDANAIVLQYSDFGHFNPVYRSKHKNLDDTVLSAIRTYGAGIEEALVANDMDLFESRKAAAGLNRSDDKYHTNEEMTEELESEDYQLFAGGYAIDSNGNKIEAGTFEAPVNTTFTGKGIGRVYTSIRANADGTEDEYKTAVLAQYGIANTGVKAGHDVAKTFTTNSATLKVKENGDQELVMNFPDFYRVTATKLAAGGDPTITFDNPNSVAIEKKYMRTADVNVPTYDTESHQVISNGSVTPETPVFQPGYYGVGTASEAAGSVRYAEKAGNIQVKDKDHETTKTFTREFEFQGAYGMKTAE